MASSALSEPTRVVVGGLPGGFAATLTASGRFPTLPLFLHRTPEAQRETDVSAQQSEAKEEPRLPRPHAHEERPCSPGPTPQEGTEAPRRLTGRVTFPGLRRSVRQGRPTRLARPTAHASHEPAGSPHESSSVSSTTGDVVCPARPSPCSRSPMRSTNVASASPRRASSAGPCCATAPSVGCARSSVVSAIASIRPTIW